MFSNDAHAELLERLKVFRRLSETLNLRDDAVEGWICICQMRQFVSLALVQNWRPLHIICYNFY